VKLSINSNNIVNAYGLQKAVDFFADTGFDAIDFSMFNEEYCTDAHDKSFYQEARLKAEARGICFNQAHAPFGSSFTDPAETQKRFQEIVTAMKIASWLGVPNIIVHPCQHLTYDNPGVPEQLFEINMAFYRSLIPYCEEYGIKVAVENMWQYPKMISHSTCSRPEEFLRYMDNLDTEHFVACLDIGHAVLVREKPDDMVRALGNKYLKTLHVHDVDGIRDSHTIPYRGIADWAAVTKALGEIDYSGDLTFEVGDFGAFPMELWPGLSRHMVDIGRYLISLVHANRK